MNEQPLDDSTPADKGADSANTEQIRAIVEEYARQLAAGRLPDPYELMVLYLPLARELEDRLKVVEMLNAGRREAGDAAVVSKLAPAQSSASPANERPTIGRYEILEQLGAGASAIVYRAWDPKYERQVALKVLHAEITATRTAALRFDREAPIIARLRHPNIVPLHESGEVDGKRYLDTELIVGETLQQRLDRQPRLTHTQSAQSVAKLAAAVDYAHREGIVHRDIKPSNIILDSRGEPQLADFGLARRCEAGRSLTAHGEMIGTPAYMAPEQCARSSTADPRCDVYSLGVILYELLVGRRPFDRSDSVAALLYEIVHHDPPFPRKLDPTIPRSLEMICLKALQKSPADRFQAAGQMADELRRWLNDEPSQLRRPTPWEIVRRWARRNQLSAWTIAAATAIVLCFSLIAYWKHTQSTLHAQAEAHVRIVSLHDAARQRLREPTAGRRRDAQELLGQIAAHRKFLSEGEIDRLDLETRSLFAWSLATPELIVRQQAELSGPWYRSWPVAIHPDGRSMAVGTASRPCLWRQGESFRLPPDLTSPVPGSRLIFSPDGQYLVCAPDAGGIEVWDAEITRILGRWGNEVSRPTLALGFRAPETLLACTTDGRVHAFYLPDLDVKTGWDVEGGNKVWTAAAFNSDATVLARGAATGFVQIFSPDGKLLREFSADTTQVESLAWSPDGNQIAVGSHSGVVRLWDLQTGLPSAPYYVGITGVGSIVFTPDGRLLLAGQRGTATKVWDLATGQQVLTGPGPLSQVFSRDGQLIAAGAKDHLRFCELSRPAEIQELSAHGRTVQQVVWSADSRRLATIDSGFQIHVWEVGSSAPVCSFQAQAEEFYAHRSCAGLALSPDGGTLAYISGGRNVSYWFIRNTETRELLGEGTLSGAYEHLVATGDDTFLLAREEVEPDGKTRQTTLYRWRSGDAPQPWKVLRSPEPGEAGFFMGELTRDGRYYTWSGPRVPQDAARVEVWEIATGAVRRFYPQSHPPDRETNFCISDDARHLWVGPSEVSSYFDLTTRASISMATTLPNIASADGSWLMVQAGEKHQLCRRGQERQPWLEFMAWDDVSPSLGMAFSPRGRYFAWGTPGGAIRVADLSALELRIAEFSKERSSK